MGGEKWYLATLYILQREEILLISEYHCNQPPISSPFPRNLVLFMHFTSAFLKFQDLHERNKKLWKLYVLVFIVYYCQAWARSIPGPFHVTISNKLLWSPRGDRMTAKITWHSEHSIHSFYDALMHKANHKIQSYWGSLTLKWIRSCSRSNLSMFFL